MTISTLVFECLLNDCLQKIGVVGKPMPQNGLMKILSVSEDNYLKILHYVLVPQLRTKANFDELYFQQGGEPLHYAWTVMEYLHQAFPQRWFGEQGSIE